MKKSKQKLFILIGVLLLSVGLSCAYFVATSLFNGVGAKVEGTTASINGATINVEGTLEFNDLNILPGHKTVSAIKVTATGDNELIPYNLVWKGTNSLNTPLNFTVYKTSTPVEVSATCEKKTKVENGAQILNEECTISNIDSLGTAISSGTIGSSEAEATTILVEDEFLTAISGGQSVYYYVMLEYPNLNESQNSDIGGSFGGKVTVEESNAKPDINIIAAYIKQEDGTYQKVSDIPQSEYVVNKEKSVCSNGATPGWDVSNHRFYVDNLNKSETSCYLYFDKYSVRKVILANNTIDTSRKSGSISGVFTESGSGKIYEATDDDGTTYFFAGANPKNWVQFAGFYWRIIRINGDGTLRLIYNGTNNTTIGSGTQISTSAFNTNYNDNAYVGFMYGQTSASSYVATHTNTTSSTIKGVLDSWYTNNIGNNIDYSNKIDTNAGFCGDRQPSTNASILNGSGGTGTIMTFYGPYIRAHRTHQFTYNCKTTSDLYTVSSSSKGNKALSKPIGLITMDEVVYAGGYTEANNTSYWLYTGQHYWTMSPYYVNSYGNAVVFYVLSTGRLAGDWYVADTDDGVRPVINLRADTVFSSGDGTADNPYVVAD